MIAAFFLLLYACCSLRLCGGLEGGSNSSHSSHSSHQTEMRFREEDGGAKLAAEEGKKNSSAPSNLHPLVFLPHHTQEEVKKVAVKASKKVQYTVYWAHLIRSVHIVAAPLNSTTG